MAQFPMKGHCICQTIQYTLNAAPIFVNCCHCRDCQCMSGSAFAVNIMVEASNVQITSTTPPVHQPDPRFGRDPHASKAMHCPSCNAMIWGTLSIFGDGIVFLRAGTLEENEKIVPDAHFFTRSKHPWVTIPEGVATYQAMPGPDDGPLFNAEANARLGAAKKTPT